MENTNFGKINNMRVAGTSFRQSQIWALRGAGRAYLTLRREPHNQYDPNAIQVIAHMLTKAGTWSVFQVGYIPKDTAVWMAPAMDEGKVVRINRYAIVGGYAGRKTMGIRMNLVHELPSVATLNA